MIRGRLAFVASVAALGAFGSAPAAAQERETGAYAGGDIVIVSTVLRYRLTSGGSSVDETYQSAHLRVRAGYRITKMFALEAQFVGSNDDTQADPFANPYKMTTGPIVGLYGRLSVPLGQQAGLYGLAGIASVESKYQAAAPGAPADTDKVSRLSFGAGLEVFVTERLRASADLMFYRHGSVNYPNYFTGGTPEQSVAGLGFGLSYLF